MRPPCAFTQIDPAINFSSSEFNNNASIFLNKSVNDEDRSIIISTLASIKKTKIMTVARFYHCKLKKIIHKHVGALNDYPIGIWRENEKAKRKDGTLVAGAD
jgi:hypothetical protein